MSANKDMFLAAVRDKHLAHMKACKTNLEVYNSPVGIGEHGDLVSTVEDLVGKYVSSKEMVQACDELLKYTTYET